MTKSNFRTAGESTQYRNGIKQRFSVSEYSPDKSTAVFKRDTLGTPVPRTMQPKWRPLVALPELRKDLLQAGLPIVGATQSDARIAECATRMAAIGCFTRIKKNLLQAGLPIVGAT